VLVDPRATAPRDSESIQKMTSGGAHRRSKVGFSFKRNGKRNVLVFRRWFNADERLFWGLSSIAGADRVGTAPARQISNIRIFASADERSRLAERSEHRAAAARLQLI
jgi:hypothetical protein